MENFHDRRNDVFKEMVRREHARLSGVTPNEIKITGFHTKTEPGAYESPWPVAMGPWDGEDLPEHFYSSTHVLRSEHTNNVGDTHALSWGVDANVEKSPDLFGHTVPEGK